MTFLHSHGRNASRLAPRTDPRMKFSLTGLLGYTRFRTDCYYNQMTIPHNEFCLQCSESTVFGIGNMGSSLSIPYYLFCFIWQGRCGVERLDPVMYCYIPS